MRVKSILALAVASTLAPPASSSPSASAAALFVDCGAGSDAAPGTSPAPFLTLRRARDAVRALQPLAGGATVSVRGDCFGADAAYARNYSLPALLLDSPLDSGASEGAPVVWQSWPGFAARLLGGAPVPSAAWAPAPAPAPAGAVQVSLAALGLAGLDVGDLVGDLGSLGECTWGRTQLFFGGAAQPVARFPNPMANGTWQWDRTLNVSSDGRSFSVLDPEGRAAGGAAAPDPQGLGYWSQDWAWNAVHVSVVTGDGTATLTAAPGDSFWGGVLKGARFQVANVISEIDVPGEHVVERTAGGGGGGGTVTFLPPQPVNAPGDDAFLSFADAVVFAGVDPATLPGLGSQNAGGTYHLRNNNDLMQRNTVPGAAVQVGNRSAAVLRHVELRGLTIAFARGTGIVAGAVDDFAVSDCDVSHHGRNGALLAGTRVAVARSTFSDVGCSGVLLYGGDDLELLDAGSSIVDSTIANFSSFVRTYTPGIGWAGVGLDVRNVSLRHAPHSAVMGSGNNAHFDALAVVDVAFEVSDSGAFYSGYSWVKRGNSVTSSHFRDIVNIERIYNGYPSVQGVYLDDQMSGWSIVGNRFENVMQGSMLGGGRDNVFAANVFIGVTHGQAVEYDNRGQSWQHESCVHNSTWTGRLAQDLFNVKYQQPPYATRYPELVRLLDESPCAPYNNTLANNTYCNVAGGFTSLTPQQAANWSDVLVNNSEACR